MRRSPRDRALGALGIAASALLHFLVIWFADIWWSDTRQSEAFRNRLALRPRFEPRRLTASRPESLPTPQTAYVTSEAIPPQPGDVNTEPPPLPSSLDLARSLATALAAPAPGMRADTAATGRQRMLSPAEYESGGLSEGETAMDLLRMQDLAAADGYRAAVVAGGSGRRDIRGFINFTRLNLYGSGAGRTGELDGVARHLRDYTGLFAQVRGAQHRHFLAEELLKDPIHFLLQGGGMPIWQDAVLVNFSEAEKSMLGRYLREGGFLFIESASNSPHQYRYLTQMLALLHEVLGVEARLLPIPTTHPIYHSFYDFDSGFPGEYHKEDIPDAASVGDSWYYPGITKPGRLAQQTADVQVLRRRLGPGVPQEQEPVLPSVGLYAAELGGRTVAVISDLGLHGHWVTQGGADFEGTEADTGPFLMAGVNVVAYALQRLEAPVVRRSQPTWVASRPEQQVTSAGGGDLEGTPERMDAELLTSLDASLAVVLSPLGASISNGLRLRFDDGNAIDSTTEATNGLLLHNLRAGTHSLELWYQGKRGDLEVMLEGGKVSTVTFALNRLMMFSRLTMRQRQELVALEQWSSSFADLLIEERFLDEAWVP